MNKQLIQDIKTLMGVVMGRDKTTDIAVQFSENNLSPEDLLRVKFNELYDVTEFYTDDSSKKACFALIAESVAQELPKRVAEQFGIFVEQTTCKVGDRPRFKYKLGRKALKKFVTKGSQAGTYRRGTMDRGFIEFDYYTMVGAVRLELREYLSGFMTMSDLQEVILETATEQIYADIQNMLKATFDSLPAPNKHTASSFVETEMDKVISTVSAYGEPVIFCTKRFAQSIPTTLLSANDSKAVNDMHKYGYVLDYKGTKITILQQSFEDETNETTIIDDGYAFVLPTGKEALIKLVHEGQMRITEHDLQATSAKEWRFEETLGMAMIYNNHVGIYRNTTLSV